MGVEWAEEPTRSFETAVTVLVHNGKGVLAQVASANERVYEAESYRVKGEILLKHGGPDWAAEAETCFRQALDIAEAQSAKSWELRAAMSLARLWAEQGKRAQAQDLLAPVYGWFTEGFETADLKDAKALLEELR